MHKVSNIFFKSKKPSATFLLATIPQLHLPYLHKNVLDLSIDNAQCFHIRNRGKALFQATSQCKIGNFCRKRYEEIVHLRYRVE